eukprot:GHUV01002971.1.p2 GENE.GHUV01002971.1~~GHUV01002971.1.p2  ORF type:complete len:286 (+),score=109.61 GHUV01002971.1:917-1774(+)
MLGLLLTLLLASAILCHSAAVVEHSLDGRSFHQVGLIHLEDDIQDNQPIVTGRYERQPLSQDHLQQLAQLVDKDRLYLWRVKLEDQPAVLTSIKASCLAENFQSQTPVLNINAAGRIISAQLAVPASIEGTCSSSKALQNLKQLPQDVLSDPKPLKVVVNTPVAAPPVPQFPSLTEAPLDPYAAAAGGGPAPAQRPQQPGQRAPGQPRQSSDGDQQQGEGSEGEQQPPPPDTRTWWQKNWLFVMAAGTMVLNMALKAAAGDVPQQGQPAAAARPGGGQARAAGRR